ELISSDLHQRTTDIWANGSAVRIDLFVPDVFAALPGVQAAARGCGWAISVDANAQMLLKAKQHGAFALYLDAVSAADGGHFLTSLATQGRAGAKLGVAHLSVAGAADHREIKDLLGADPKPTTMHPTAEQVSKIKKPTPKHTALLFALTPPTARPVATSKEVRAFADGRTTRKSGAVPLIVVIRTADGAGL
ncbi:MAG: hypothetical protein K1Y02_26470, partial [Candidatus Hydrogenedentes bacterium]|nr:hypothetical protein [Candidatus Hydrogenedentota bacterium]